MKRINKLLALLLCAVMIFSTIPVQGFASETETADTSALIQPEVEPAAASDAVMVEHNGETTYYADLHTAFDGFAPSNNTYGGKYVITLLSDVSGMTAVKNLQYPTEILDITLDLNGHTITGNGTNIADLTVGVSEARGEKCPRCWMHSTQANAEGLCPRCAAVIAKMDLEF